MKPEQYQPKLSTTGKMAVALSLAFIGQVAVAANIEAVGGGASVSQQNKVDIVNIVAPNDHGLSHNQYNKFNVSKHGAVLNNALEAGKSNLAGNLQANTNFQGKAASVILNEVVSKNPSLILGQQEIFGMAADYVLANPNGITYNGSNIQNASRASLVVGRPDIQGGSLKAFAIGADGSATELKVQGKMSGNSVVDLYAPKVVVSKGANINAGSINVVSGANKIGYVDGNIEKLEQAKNAPVLDGQVFGSMRAGSIRIHGTDSRATQKFEGAHVQADNLAVNTEGNIQVRAAQLAGGDISLTAKNTVVDGVKSKDTKFHHDQNVLAKNVRETKSGSTLTERFVGSNITATGALDLQNTGDVALNGASINAGSLNVAAKNVKTDLFTTTNRTSDLQSLTKGSWFNTTKTEKVDNAVHATKINVKAGAVVDASESLTLKASVLNVGGDAKLVGKKGIVMSGVAESDSSSQRVDFARETAKLKTGYGSKSNSTQTQHATEINVGGDFGLVTGKVLDSKSAKIKVAGNVVTDAAKVNLGTQVTANQASIDDKLKFWGGIGGGQDGMSNQRNETLHSTSIVAGGNILLGAKNGVDAAGATIKGKTGTFVNAGTGKVNVRSATTNNHAVSSSRKGTVFNITRARQHSSSHIQEVNGTVLQSDANLTIVADKDINVIGSSLQAAQKLGINTAGNLNIAAARAGSSSTNHEFSIKGKTTPSASLKDGSVSLGLGLVFTNTTTNTMGMTHTGSNVSGSDVDLNAKNNVNVVGSQVNATNNVNINAANVSVTAAKDIAVTNEKQRVTDVGITAKASYNGGAPKVGVSAGVSSKFTNTDTTNVTSQVSGIQAGKNVNVTASQNITHEGTNIQAGGDVNQTAKNITNNAAQNSSNVSTVHHQGGIGIGASIDTAKNVTVEGSIYGQGGKAKTTSTTAVAGSVAANNVNLTAESDVTDVATNYQANGDINVKAKNYNNVAAKNTQTVDSKQGGASVGVAVSTNDGQTFNVDANIGVNYADQHGKSSQAVKGSMNAKNVNVAAGNQAAIASDITAKENVTVTATNGVAFTQSQDTSESNSTSVDVGLSVGAKVHVSGAVAPRGKISVGVEKANQAKTTGSAGTVTSGQDIVATAATGNVKVDGANLVAENLVKLEGKAVESNGLTNTRKENGVSVGVALGGSSTLTETEVSETVTTSEQHWVRDSYCVRVPPRLVMVKNTETTDQRTEIGSQVVDASIGLNVGVKKEDEVSHKANVIIGKGGMTTTPDRVIKEPDTIVKEPDTIVKEPDTIVKEPDTIIREPGRTETIPAVTKPSYDDNGTVIGEEIITPSKVVEVPGKETVIPGKETVIPGKTSQTGGVIINANSSGNGVSIKGTNITAGVASITNAGGNVHIGSQEGHLNKTNVAVGIGLTADVNNPDCGTLIPNSGSASVSVDLAKNKTYTGSNVVAADAVNINAKKDLSLVSSTVTAPNVQGKVGGNVHIEAQQDVVNATAVHVGVGLGKKGDGLGESTVEVVDHSVQQECDACGIHRVETTRVATETTRELGSKVEGAQTAYNNAAIAAGGTLLQGAQAVAGVVDIANTIKKGDKVKRDDIAYTLNAGAGAITTAAQDKQAASAISSDIATGSIAGVHAHLNVGVDVEKSKTTKATGIQADALDLGVNGTVSNQAGQVEYNKGTGLGNAKVVHSGHNTDSSKKIAGHLNLTTDVSQNIAYAIEHAQTGKSPVVGGKVVRAPSRKVVSNIAQRTAARRAPSNKVINSAYTNAFNS